MLTVKYVVEESAYEGCERRCVYPTCDVWTFTQVGYDTGEERGYAPVCVLHVGKAEEWLDELLRPVAR